MRKLVYFCVLLSGMVFLNTCDLFNPGLGDNVDINPPLLFVTSHANGAFVSGSITLAGNFEEDIAVASIYVDFNNGLPPTPAVLNQTARTWSLNVDTTTIPDGERDVLFSITDTAGKVTDKKILLYFDNTAPLVMMTVPAVYGGSATYYGSAFQVKGEAADTFGIQSVTVQIWDNAETTLLATPTVNGTGSWNCTFNSATYIPTTGTLKFNITVTDRAGNVSTKYYHYSDIYTANSYTPITIDDIYRIYTNQLVNAPVKTYLDNNGNTRIDLYFDQDSNKPTVEIFNPDQNQPPANNILTNTSRLSGKAIDEDGIAAGSVEVYVLKDGETIPAINWASTGNPLSPSVNWSYVLPGAPTITDGNYTVRVRASDQYGNQRVTNAIGFVVDSGAPVITVTQPTQGQYLNGNFTIAGTAIDINGIASVEVSLNDGVTYSNATLDAYPDWHFDVVNPAEGSMLIKVRATDTTPRTSTYNLQVIIDKTNPAAGFLNPSLSSTVNGLVLIRGTSSDNTQITNAELRLGLPAVWIPMTNYYNWEYEIDSTNYANATYAVETPPGSGVWQLNVQARITDRAGNVYTKTDYYFLIDNNTDKPVVSILAPQVGAVVGGSTVVSGTAIDDDGLYRVYMSVDLDNDGFDVDDEYNLNGNGITGGSQIGTVAGMPIGDPAELFEDEGFWYELTGTTQWTVELNGNGELYHINGQNGQITVRVAAVDSKNGGVTPDIKGNNQVRSFRFDDTIPGFQNMTHDSSYFVRKDFYLGGVAVDDQHVDKIEISYNGGVNWTTFYDPASTPWIATYDFTVSVPIDRRIHIDTETINGGVFAGSTGILYLRLKATDNTGYTKLQLIDLKVDNDYPDSTYSGSLGDIYGSTTNSFVQGTATDIGTVSGTKQVEVYFMRGSTVYNPRVSGSTTLSTVNFGDGSGNVYYTDDPTYKIIIDQPYENGLSDIDGDTFKETFTVQGNDTLWSTQFNSALITDGSITIHYVVVDMALNKHHYQTTGSIKNFKPVVTGIKVGSDVNFSNAVDGGELYDYLPHPTPAYSPSNTFKVRNHLRIEITANDPGGTIPGITNYQFFNGAVSKQSSSSNVYDVDLSGYSDGDTSFTCVITDGDSITTTTETIYVTIQKTDGADPSIAIDAFDADSNPDNNIVAGHIELPADSEYDNGITNGDGIADDADVSGIILLTGTASDNFYVDEIELTLDPSGATTVAQWNGTAHTLQAVAGLPNNGVFTIIDQDITPAGGHTVTWSYRWETQTITNVANANHQPLFAVNDAAARSGLDSESYDVVPYITGLERSLGPEGTTRSRYGKYIVREGTAETNLLIQGYNLAKPGTYGTDSWVRVCRTGSDAVYDQIADGKVSVNGTYTVLTITDLADVTHSGELRVRVNNVGDGNYINDDTKNNNKEDDGSGLASTLWTDNRYLQVWQVGGIFGATGTPNDSANAEYPSMSINSTGTLYGAWIDRSGQRLYYATPGGARTSVFNMFDPPEYTDISLDSNNNINIAFMANQYAGTWTCAETDDLGSVAGWVSDQTMPTQTSNFFSSAYMQFEKLCHNNYLLQFPRPMVARNGDNFHIAYYDQYASAAKYAYVDVNPAPNENEITTWINLDGTVNGDAEALSDASPARSASSGEFVALALDEDNLPVVMYYDRTTNTLRLARATSTTPSTAASWVRQEVFQSGDPNKLSSGHYITMKFDATGNLYAACYNNPNGNLIYLYAPNVDGADYVFQLSELVDSAGNVGEWADISLNGNTPYISYLNGAMAGAESGTFLGLKMAYKTGGNWEYSTIPVNIEVKKARTNIEYAKGAVTWTCAVGYKGTSFDLVYLKPEE